MPAMPRLETVLDEPVVLKRKIDAILELQKAILNIIMEEEKPERDELEAIRSEDELADEDELFEVLEE